MKTKLFVAGLLAALLFVTAVSFGPRLLTPPAATAPAEQAAATPAAPAPDQPSAPAQSFARTVVPPLPPRQAALWSQAPAEPPFAAFAEWTRRYTAAPAAAARAALDSEGVTLARARLTALASLIVRQPERALELAVPNAVRQALPESVQALLEEQVNTRGDYSVFCVFPVAGKEREASPMIRSALVGGTTCQVFTYGPALDYVTRRAAPLNGIAVPVTAADVALADPIGLQSTKLMALQPSPARLLDESEASPGQFAVQFGGRVQTFATMALAADWAASATAAADLGTVQAAGDLPTAESPYTEGRKRFLVMRVDFPDYQVDVFPTNNALQHMRDMSNFLAEISYGKHVIAPVGLGSDITPTMRMSTNASAYNDAGLSKLYPEAQAKARDVYGYDLSKYDFFFVCTGGQPSYGYAGLGYVGGVGYHLANSYFDVRTSAHEFGHNLGLGHANWWSSTGPSIIGDGSSEEYGDDFDTMGGSGGGIRHFSSHFKNRLGWIADSNALTVTSSGQFRLYAHDIAAAPGGLRVIRLNRSGGDPYCLEFRQLWTGTTYKAMANGINFRWGGGASILLDMNPGSANGKNDHSLTIGRTFSDTNRNYHVTPIGKGHTYPESLDVVINIGAFATNQPPSVVASASAATASTGQTITFTATATDPNGDALAYFWDFGDADYSVDNSAVTTHSFSSAGEYYVEVTVSDMKGGTASDSVIVRVGSPTTYSISGRVLNTNNVPVTGVRVSVDSSHYAFTESDGTYNITRLSAGSYTVSALEPTLAANSFIHPFFSNPVTVGPSVTNADFISLASSLNLYTALVGKGAAWKYLDDGSDQGTNWTAPAFADTGWSNGAAILGYGQGNETTVISYGPSDTNKFITYYFRQTLTVTNPTSYTNLLLEVLRDDGVIVYINGTEVFRDNMPTNGTINYLTHAVAAVEPDSYQQRTLPVSVLQAGVNVIAAEVHQVEATSSDVNFDLALSGLNIATASGLNLVYLATPKNNQTFTNPANVTLTAFALNSIIVPSLVECFADGGKIGEDAAWPFSLVWTNPALGAHSLSIIATIGSVLFTSAPVAITVVATNAPPPPAVSLTLIATGAVWRYYATNAAPAGAWTNLVYNDASWPSGAAELGYGDGGEATLVPYGTNANNKWITSYYRRAFVVNDPASVTNLVLRLKRDDGAVVYLNGVEIVRDLLPPGAITWGTLATNAADDGAYFSNFVVAPLLLWPGTNLVAVEIHQSTNNSSDISFDLALSAIASTNRSRGVWLTAPTNGATVQLPANITLAAQAVAGGTFGVAKVEFFAEGVKIGEDASSPFSLVWSNPPGGVFNLTSVATDSAGGSVTSAPVQVTLVAPLPGDALVSFGDVWKYLDEGSNLGTNWTARSFNDRLWLAGAARLGYGGDGELTTLSYGPNAASKFITTYFRKAFIVANPSAFSGVLLRLVRDDGAVVYLNGREVLRTNLLAGVPVSYDSLALNAVNAPEETTPIDITLSATNLLAGTNVLAVEVHQATVDSSDLGFDLALVGLLPTNITAGVYLTGPADGAHFNLPGSVPLSAYAVAGGTVSLVEYFDGTNKLGQATASPYSFSWSNAAAGLHPLTARATYGAGYAMTSAPVAVVVSPAPPPIAPIAPTLIPARSDWKYWDSSDAVGVAWQAPAFDDSAWPFGVARFGWGFDGERTLLTEGRITHYFRRWFTVAEPGLLTELLFQLARDDGAVVYLNDKEVFRSNMPSGPVTSNTLASTTVNTPDETTYFETAIATLGSGLVAGSNVVAVELHQGSAASSDAGFDLQLIGSGTSEGRVYFTAPTNGTACTVYDTIHLEAAAWSASNAAISQVEFLVDGLVLAGISAPPYRYDWGNLPPLSHMLTARATDSRGQTLLSDPLTINISLPLVAATFVPSNSAWKYLDNGSNQGTNWAQPAFNDSTWSNGLARLGYGGDGEVTTVRFGSSSTSKYITTYFRRAFVAPSDVLFTNLTCKLLRDDGAVVWLNGRELYRSNMDTNTAVLNYLAHALTSVTGTDEQTFFTNTFSAARLLPGTNVLAVEVHQYDGTSSDLSFNLELTGYGYVDDTATAKISCSLTSGNIKLAWPANAFGYRLYTSPQLSGPGNVWSPVSASPQTTNGQNSVTLPASGGQQLFRLGKP